MGPRAAGTPSRGGTCRRAQQLLKGLSKQSHEQERQRLIIAQAARFHVRFCATAPAHRVWRGAAAAPFETAPRGAAASRQEKQQDYAPRAGL